MPIKPENKHLYPKNWKEIRAEVLDRDGHRCAWCRVENHAIIIRYPWKKQYHYLETGRLHCQETGADRGYESIDHCSPGRQAIKVVLTIAHLDHDPRNNGETGSRPNLAALCQMHHLRHDAAIHAENAAITRSAKRGQPDLFK